MSKWNIKLVRPYLLPSGELMADIQMSGLRRFQRRWQQRFMVRYEPFYRARRLYTFDRRQRYGRNHSTSILRAY